MDFKFQEIILNLQRFIDEPYVTKKVRALIQDTVPDQGEFCYKEMRPWSRYFHNRSIIREIKLEIRAKCSFPKVSLQLSPNKDNVVNPRFVMKIIDNVAENLRDLLIFSYSRNFFRVPENQIAMVLKELKFLRGFVCFVSSRCIETKIQDTLFTHVLVVVWYTTMTAWLYLPNDNYTCLEATSVDETNSLFLGLLQERMQHTEPTICKIYIDVLQALKLEESRWYPIISVKHVVDCEVGFTKTLLHHLKEIPIYSNGAAIKATLQEMLNFLKTKLINLPVHALEFHLQEIDSAIIDAGVLVYSLYDKKEETVMEETNQVFILDFAGKIQSMQAVIYLITRKSFHLQSDLYRADGVGSTDFILDNLKDLVSLYSNSIDCVKSLLQTIQNELKCFQSVVAQQDGLQHLSAQLIGLAYEVEYIFDACKKKDVPDWCLFFWILNIGEDIRVLMAEVAEIQEKDVSDLALHDTEDATRSHNSSRLTMNPVVNDEVVGLTNVMDELRGTLVEGSSNLDVVSIVGMPGVGKTTLANKLYFDQSVVAHFDIRAQCCVSQEYTRKDLLSTILGDLIGRTARLDEEAEDVLADKLRKQLFGARYLILIDDIWETSAWDDLKLCFHDANNGSRIILTTRHYDVAFHAKHDTDPLVLQLLSNDESWMLLQNKVFNKESCPLALQDVGKRIAQKCGGLPLSIVLVAGTLARMEKEKHCWEQVAADLGPHIHAQSEDTINLSYQSLPHHLKLCFLYFGVFSEDREIQVSKLTWLWISEGFVKAHTEKLSEDIANGYLDNLVERNLVMVAKNSFDGKIKACRIHDLLLEFCRKKAKLENFLERIKGDSHTYPFHCFAPECKTPCRLSLYSRCSDLAKRCLSFSHLKSFQFRESRNIAFSSINLASYTFRRFKFLRVLDIELTIVDSFPQELTLLRYLAFRTAKDTLSLPANLLNLETLIVQGLGGRVSVPDTIWEMVKLRHLHIYDQAFFTLNKEEGFSESSSKMDDLQTISSVCFSCVENADKVLEKTPNLRKLRCEVSKLDGSFPAFSKLKKLEMLKISSGSTLTWINNLKFPSYLKKLTLSNFCINLNEVTTLSNLEVEVLKLVGVTISSNTWKVKDEQFSKLKFLKLENPSFSEWDVSDGAFPCLEHLVLKRCRHLKVIPSCFGYMPSLKSIEVKSCKESLAESAIVIKGMQVEEIGYSGFEVFIHNLNNDTPLLRP
ncbi:hypothetical protein HAX54_033335 [Datura stramonium]|uniref:Uncharacterized protein n=1 Tax=Datura stramonium TaxID=4076 RepID=A0ABS8SD90_DATST|nr:hypothetical protein [Datura stramonium]